MKVSKNHSKVVLTLTRQEAELLQHFYCFGRASFKNCVVHKELLQFTKDLYHALAKVDVII